MKTPTVEEELRLEHETEVKRAELVDTLRELERRGHVAAETIEEVSLGPLVPIAVVSVVALGAAVLVGDAIHAMRRRTRLRRFRRRLRRVFA